MDCDYCGESFADEGAYHDHLRSAHLDELGPIDRRLVGADDDGGSGMSSTPVALVVVLVLAVAVVGYVVFIAGGGGSTPEGVGAPGSAHYHGTMEVSVLGDRVDFSRSEYQLRADRFHFEAGDGTEWHAHATGVTLGFAVETLGFEVTADSFTYEGTTYVDGEGYDVTVQVNGDPVGPGYTLTEGDRVRIRVTEA